MLKYRIVSGIVLSAAVLVMVTMLPALCVVLVILCFSVFAQLEFYKLASKAGVTVFKRFGIFCGMVLVLAASMLHTAEGSQTRVTEWACIVMVMCVMAVFIRQFPAMHNTRPLETMGCTLLGIVYVPFLLSFISFLLFRFESTNLYDPLPSTGKLCFVYLVVVTKSADIGAYFAGKKFGRRKLLLRISPGKTWEGLCGGVAMALVASFVFWTISGGSLGQIRFSAGHSLALGAILTISGVVGDLFESLIKRSANVKDSSNLIPGMGGLLDVLDSLFFAAPVLCFYLLFLI